jgi:acyl-CoA synthetase (AMP-forming)/AMP-acid ligase II
MVHCTALLCSALLHCTVVIQDVNLNTLLPTLSSERPLRSFREGIKLLDPFAFVYTSGTTGMPKAAVISHLRMTLMPSAFYRIFSIRTDDVVYTVLPLYHSAGGLIGAGLVTVCGLTMVLRDRYVGGRRNARCAVLLCDVCVVGGGDRAVPCGAVRCPAVSCRVIM